MALVKVGLVAALFWLAGNAVFGFRPTHFDINIFYNAGVAFRDGGNPYANIPPNLNAPVSLYVFRLFTALSREHLFALTLIWSIVGYCAVLAVLLFRFPEHRKPVAVTWALVLPGFWELLGLGQIYVPLLVLVTTAYFVMDDRPTLAGLCIGLLVAFKPSFVVWPVLLLIGGNRRAGFVAILVAALLSAIPLLDAGVTIYRQYFDAIDAFGGASQRYGNASLPAALVRFGLPDLSAFIMVAGTVAIGVYIKRLRPDSKALNDLGITSAILFAPLAWSCYVIYLLPVLFSRPWRWPEWLSLALFSLPLWLVGVSEHVRTYGLAYFVALVVLFAAIILAGTPAARALRFRTPEPEQEALAVGVAA